MKRIIIRICCLLAACTITQVKANPVMESDTIRIIVIGAHPDDCDLRAGGLAALYSRMGHKVKFVSLTNGDKGHQTMGGGPLASRRFKEAKEAGRRLGITYDVLDNHDGELMPTLENRMQVIRLIREWNADIVISSRPNDYHPDHRNTGLLVQDAAYLVIVPNILSSVPALKKNPLFLYARDSFIHPYPFHPDIAIDILPVLQQKANAMDAHVSQYYEWLPWTENALDQVPADTSERRKWLAKNASENLTEEKKAALEKWYGREAAAKITDVESFEICEYGLQPKDSDIRKLFPMLPAEKKSSLSGAPSKESISLFDGKTLQGWHSFNKKGAINNWIVKDGALVCLGAIQKADYGGDLVSDRDFDNFELSWEWKVDAGSNSGLMYHVLEGPEFRAPYETGPEFQLMDDAAYANGRADADQLAGANYGMYAANKNKTLNPTGKWNKSKLLYYNGHIEHWLNGKKIVEFEEGSNEWNAKKLSGKWKDFLSYATAKKGKICLQDHGHKAYFRNISLNPL